MSIEFNHPINYLSAIGLIIDLIGVIYLLKFGLPSKLINKRGPSIIGNFTKEQEKLIDSHNAKIKRGANIGLVCVLIGFILQFGGTLLRMS